MAENLESISVDWASGKRAGRHPGGTGLPLISSTETALAQCNAAGGALNLL